MIGQELILGRRGDARAVFFRPGPRVSVRSAPMAASSQMSLLRLQPAADIIFPLCLGKLWKIHHDEVAHP